MRERHPTRPEVLASGLALGAGALLGPLAGPADSPPRRPGKLTDIDRVVIMIQENRDDFFTDLATGALPRCSG
jgi:phospholipase C